MVLLLLGNFYAFLFQEPQTLNKVSVHIAVDKVSVRQLMTTLEKQSDYRFFYNTGLFDDNKEITLNYDGNLDGAIKLILGNLITYSVSGKQIILRKTFSGVAAMSAAQELPGSRLFISGVVTDNIAAPIPGANVVVKGTNLGSTTNSDGKYSLEVPDGNSILSFSFIGYKRIEVPIAHRNSINISMENDDKELDEVVVVGYGSVKKSDLTGSISTISKQDIGDRQTAAIEYLIQGRATGVDVSQGTIRVRGVTSFNNTDPLIVIDGFIGGNLATLNPNDIENIEILKDASSTAIYGARGANGVILITTKMGKPGTLTMNVKYYEGVSLIPGRVDVMTANDYTDYALEILRNSNLEPTPKLLTGETRVDRTDWQNEAFRTGHNRELNLDFSGGVEKASFYLSIGYRHLENPTYMGRKDDFIFLNNRNIFNIRKWIKLGNGLSAAFNSYQGHGAAGNPGNLLSILNAAQYIPVYAADGKPSATNRNDDVIEFSNPVTNALNNHLEGDNINFQSTLWLELQPLKGLSYKFIAGANGVFGRDQYSNDEYTGGEAGPGTLPATITKLNNYRISPLLEQYITYKTTLGQHDILIMVGNTWQNGFRSQSVGARGQNYDPRIPNLLNAQTNLVVEDELNKYAYLSYYARINYQVANKYLVTVNFRSDASPKFPPGHRWGSFPSVSFAWKIHEENFLQSSIFDQLKLRVGWGISGNDAIGDFRYQAKVYTTNVYYVFGPQNMRVNGATVLNRSAPNLKWESTQSESVGLDISVLKGKLNITSDFYIKNTDNILYEVPRALSSGYGNSQSNAGVITNAASLRNRGFEVQTGYRSSIGKLNYNVNFFYTHNTNKVTSLGDGLFLDGINRTEVGFPLAYFYGYVADGVFMTRSELDAANSAAVAKGYPNYQLATTQAGDVRFKDLNGDGHVDNNDKTKIGNSHPTDFYGLNSTFSYQGFDLNLLLQGISGSSIYDDEYDRFRGGSYVLNQSTDLNDRWRDEGHTGNGTIPRAVIGDPSQNNRVSSRKIFNGSYLKLKQLSIGYTLSTALSNNLSISKVRLYVSAYNLVTYSSLNKYYYDPEVGGTNLNRGFQSYNYPKPQMVMAGLQFSF